MTVIRTLTAIFLNCSFTIERITMSRLLSRLHINDDSIQFLRVEIIFNFSSIDAKFLANLS